MRIRAVQMAIFVYLVMGHVLPAVAQVDQQRAQEYFKEAQALCERDGGRLWGVSICAPMVIGDARTQTFATNQPPPDAPRPPPDRRMACCSTPRLLAGREPCVAAMIRQPC